MHKAIIKKIDKIKVYSTFLDNIWGDDLADMQLWVNLIKWLAFSLCYQHLWFLPIKYKKGVTISNAFQNFLNKSNRKSNKIL